MQEVYAFNTFHPYSKPAAAYQRLNGCFISTAL